MYLNNKNLVELKVDSDLNIRYSGWKMTILCVKTFEIWKLLCLSYKLFHFQLIGEEKYGMVHKALFRERPEAALKRVALKSFKYECHRSSYNNELSIYKESCTRNSQLFLRLLEADPDSRTFITEYCLMGNLYQYLKVWNPFFVYNMENSTEGNDWKYFGKSFLDYEPPRRIGFPSWGAWSTDPKPVILHRWVFLH